MVQSDSFRTSTFLGKLISILLCCFTLKFVRRQLFCASARVFSHQHWTWLANQKRNCSLQRRASRCRQQKHYTDYGVMPGINPGGRGTGRRNKTAYSCRRKAGCCTDCIKKHWVSASTSSLECRSPNRRWVICASANRWRSIRGRVFTTPTIYPTLASRKWRTPSRDSVVRRCGTPTPTSLKIVSTSTSGSPPSSD